MRILLAIDDSGFSAAAIRSVLERRWPEGSSFKVVSVVEPYSFIFGSPHDPPGKKPKELCKQRISDARAHAGQILDEAAGYLINKFPEKNVETEILEGKIEAALVEEIEKWGADLLVVGSHGRSQLSDLMMGSVSRQMMFASPCSIEIVKMPSMPTPPLPEGLEEPKNVLIPVDDSSYSRSVVEAIARNEWSKGANFLILTVVRSWVHFIPRLSSMLDGDIESVDRISVENAELTVSELLSILKKSGIPGSVRSRIEKGDPREVILRVSAEWPADLIVIGSHGRGPVSSMFLGSVSESVAFHCSCPIQIIKLKG